MSVSLILLALLLHVCVSSSKNSISHDYYSRQCIETVGVIPSTYKYPTCSYSFLLKLCEVYRTDSLIKWNLNMTGTAISTEPSLSCLHSTSSSLILHYYSNVSRKDIDTYYTSLDSEHFHGYSYIDTVKWNDDTYHKISIEVIDCDLNTNTYDIVFTTGTDSNAVRIIDGRNQYFRSDVLITNNNSSIYSGDVTHHRNSIKVCTGVESRIDGQWNIDLSKCNQTIPTSNVKHTITRCTDYASSDNVHPDDHAWSFTGDQCQLPQVQLDAFTADIIRYNITSIVYAGTSRVRTMYYDLLVYLGLPMTEFKLEQAHHNMHHQIVYNSSYFIQVHFYWLDIMSDVDKNSIKTWVHWGYELTQKEFVRYFQNIGVCVSSNNANKKNTLLLLTTGISELDQHSSNRDLNKYYAQFLYDVVTICHNTSHILVGSEMAVDYHHKLYRGIKQLSYDMATSLVPDVNSRLAASTISMLDSYHITRSWISNSDKLHYYDLERRYMGNIASLAVSNVSLQAFQYLMNGH